MRSTGTIERVLLFPRSGYSNRLQAMASSAILARQLDADFRVCWEIEDVVPDCPDQIFEASYCKKHMVTSAQCNEVWGIVRETLPRYFNELPDRSLVVLAGHDRGEQAFMPALRNAIERVPGGTTVVIVAGGQFFLDGGESQRPAEATEFRKLRHEFYEGIRFAPGIEENAGRELSSREAFIGLHLRYTDRSHQVPLERTIRKSLDAAARASGLSSVFVAADSRIRRDKWVGKVSSMGLDPWFVEHGTWDRSLSGSGPAALVDWRILSRAERLVYFSSSTFAEEAAVASRGYELSTSLAPSAVGSTFVRVRQLSHAASSYPRRHGWIRRSVSE